jgi:cathepsin B
MKLTCVVLLALVATATAAAVPSSRDLINDASHIQALNRVEGMTWVAGKNARFEGMTYEDARDSGLFGTALSHISEHLNHTLDQSVYDEMVDTQDIPASFDATQTWKGLVHPIRDQQRCGSCWAFSAAEVLGDRAAIATKKASPVLSPEDLVSCDKSDNGCGGGRLPSAWSYLQNTGIVSDACLPYTAGNGTAPSCPSKCANSETWSSSKVKAKSSYAINGVENMQKEIMTNGPIQVAFMVYKSFMSYKSGVYKKHWYEFIPEGGHAVKIVGWGTENGADYWLVANSWNTSWGLEGFFKIERGTNQCGIEKTGPPYAGMPAV